MPLIYYLCYYYYYIFFSSLKYYFSHDFFLFFFGVKSHFFTATRNQNFCVNKSMTIFFFYFLQSSLCYAVPKVRSSVSIIVVVDVYRSIVTLKITPSSFFFLSGYKIRAYCFFFLIFFFLSYIFS